MKQIIHRKDGITYEREVKVNDFDCNLNIRYFKKKREKLKEIAKTKGIDSNKLIREVLDVYIETWDKCPAKYLTKD